MVLSRRYFNLDPVYPIHENVAFDEHRHSKVINLFDGTVMQRDTFGEAFGIESHFDKQVNIPEGAYTVEASRPEAMNIRAWTFVISGSPLTKKQLYLVLKYNRLPENTEPVAFCRKIHWVWFRIGDYMVPDVVYRRVNTWLDQNTDFEFHLWTNLKDTIELFEFAPDLPTAIQVHYFDEIQEEARSVSKRLLDIVMSNDVKDLVLKTDFIRVIILRNHGGFYLDFNDTICRLPLETLFILGEENPTSEPELMVGCDSECDTNNYAIYAKPNCAKLREIVDRMLDGLVELYEVVHTHTMFMEYIPSAQELWGLLSPYARASPTCLLPDLLKMLGISTQTMKPPALFRSSFLRMDAGQHCLMIPRVLEAIHHPCAQKVADHIRREIVATIRLQFGKRIQWVNHDMIDALVWDKDACAEEWKEVARLLGDRSTIDMDAGRLIFQRVLAQLFISHTNIGAFVDAEVTKIPFCDTQRNLTALSVILHEGDGSSMGDVPDYSTHEDDIRSWI